MPRSYVSTLGSNFTQRGLIQGANRQHFPAMLRLVDIAGIVKGASEGAGLGNKFLANIRQCDAIVHIVRAFENPDIQHVRDRGAVLSRVQGNGEQQTELDQASSEGAAQSLTQQSLENAREDIEIINTELILADLQTIEKRKITLAKEAKAKPAAREQLSYIESLERHLNDGTPLSALPSLNYELIADLHLLTAKPHVPNV
jgi:ribosome-binding ATPase YchF (GTP1/OBG family)